jgi:hypothetical protein
MEESTMTCQPVLSVGAQFEEVDDTGTSHQYLILAIVNVKDQTDEDSPVLLEGNLAASPFTNSASRITWEAPLAL